ncbi:LytTR family transcriptional regulator DNA-binding domain-containing protein (plasmid) [Priestia megaterium]|uniref:ABC transporter family protein n=1 Tax=Priestia megaterium (strain ATCC 14581 / DSM 32 / CCUG 1817 / JCM 2506 / NBRC 15308 / NCIMB 9376 / NCTC 10342 / NRRL B-14308 / VKM B-512 / Ford 19) TaxID=1348623 RepID=A0A0B6AL91_PRIM2|nr:LytTR family transcriptional regulator DNA-binding domain-containing protein [Priestia megaterium]AJI25650.1 ABC transporter family protein [Priestia megaterium NBRC 15308 = ATCC 14581]KFN07519.1 ABC transporter family protein [Priestia megaterium]KGJ82759.1 transcriptional regulator [Priestia megaterium NBRC 15308 = ATCC 14581]MDR4229749.1 ATP-binding cassette domain-containing protein [Priestia megaterium]MED4399193.1 LytTR family transcriptional regulator DNA-binding domain-containing pr
MGLLSIRDLEKSIGNNILFSCVNLEIDKGEIVAIRCNHELGNQLINMITGNLPVSTGEILLNNISLNTNFKKLCRNVGVAFLDELFYERLNSKQYLAFFKQLYQVEADIDSLLKEVGLLERKKIKINNLTFSEKKRLQVARVILPQPDLIIFEEPNQNVDIESKIIIQKIITELGKQQKAVLIITSYFENAITLADNVYSLDKNGFKKIEVIDENKESIINSFLKESNTEKATFKNNASLSSSNSEKKEPLSLTMQVRFEKIPAKVNEKIILFNPTEIEFIESNEGVANLHVNGEVFPCSYTLNELFNRLEAFGFFRCHRSYIVNLQKVREVITWTRNSYSLILDDHEKSSIPLSKGKLGELKEIIGL